MWGRPISRKCEIAIPCVSEIACQSHLSCLYVSTGDNCWHDKPTVIELLEFWHALWWAVVCRCLVLISPALERWEWYNWTSGKTLWFIQRQSIILSAGVFMMYLQLNHIYHKPKTWLQSCLCIKCLAGLLSHCICLPHFHIFPGYGANSSRLLLYLQSPSPGVKLEMKPAWQGTELHKPPSVLSPGSHRLHYSVWGSFGCE